MTVERPSPVLRWWTLAAIVLLALPSCDSPPRPAPRASVGDAPSDSLQVGAADHVGVPGAAHDSLIEPVDEALAVSTFGIGSDWDLAQMPQSAVEEPRLEIRPAQSFELFHIASPELTEKASKEESNADMSLRNKDFPRTYIESIHVDLTSPNHWVHLTWTGPRADRQETGPFHSSPGRGFGRNDCDDVQESTRNGSNCTPKGENVVEGFSDYLPSVPRCQFVTWFNMARQIAFHSHWQVPDYPASHGCVRLSSHAAQLIHNNARIGETRVFVDGTWSR